MSALHAISTPYSTSVSVPLYAITARSIATPYSTSVSVPLYAITARGLLPRHIVRQFQSPYTPSSRGLSRISARQVALALASRFSRMLSFQIKDMEFTALDSANAFVSPGVNSRGELVPSYGASRRRLGD